MPSPRPDQTTPSGSAPGPPGAIDRLFDTTDRGDIARVLQIDNEHDALTGLPNRTLLADRVALALRAGKRTAAVTALLLVDLDRFKEVNDTLGHRVGDQLLSLIGPTLAQALREADTVARLGGDEFAVALPAVDGVAGASRSSVALVRRARQSRSSARVSAERGAPSRGSRAIVFA